MPATYDPIATQTLGSDTANVTFSSISATFTDLILVATVANTSTQTLYVRFNGDSGTNYSATYLSGYGNAVISGRQGTIDRLLLGSINVGMSATEATVFIAQFNNYSNATTFKTSISRSSLSSGEVNAVTGTWRSTAAISSILVLPSAGSFKAGSTFTLYGIKAA